jgi:O-phospho-L-seryl-tRNASec:L-selenocysteinyl-tRNA synthase
MDIDKIIEGLIPENMLKRGQVTLSALLQPVKDLLHQRRMPMEGFSERQLEFLLILLSSLDSDKDPGAARVGEREGRVASPFIERLSAGFNHGVGRSGHLTSPQPKAVGGSLMQQIANQVAVDAIRQLGLNNIHDGIITPLSTGMTLAMVLASFRQEYGVKRVLYPRIDHLSPQRGIAFTGLDLVTVPTLVEGDAVVADMGAFETALSSQEDCAVLATTTFFPPRAPDPIKDIARLCQSNDVPLVINNAYGVQSQSIMSQVRSAIDAGRVDAVVQSTDKNFLAPVGGSIVVSPRTETISSIAETYAGRASAAPVVQALAALLALGLNRYHELMADQVKCRAFLEDELRAIGEKIGQSVLDVPNPIACAITMDGLDVVELGSRLFNHRVTGPRAVAAGTFGSSVDAYPHSYLVMNAAIGVLEKDVQDATTKLYKEVTNLSR